MVSLLALAASQRAALLRRDRAAGADLLRAYALVRRRLQADLDALTARMASARAAGETVSRAWLAREVRYHRLLAQVEAQVGQFARIAEGRILTEQRLAALAGGEQATALIRAALPDGGVGVAFNRLPAQALGELVGVLGDGSPLSSLLGQLGPQAGQSVRAALIEGVGAGLGPRQIAREVVKATDLSAVRALRIARNETLRAFRSASQEMYKANADILSGWVWWAALSKRTCPVCYAMHGTFHKLDEQFASHVACRCTQLPQTKGSRLAVTRGAEAFKRLPDEDQRAILGPGKFAAYQRGDLALDDLVAKTRDKDWGPGRRERSMGELGLMRRPVVPKMLPEPPLLRPGSFRTYRDAERWGAATYPNIRWDLADIHRDVLNPTLAQFDKLAKEWPDVAKGLKYVGTYSDPAATQVLGNVSASARRAELKRALAHANDELIAFNIDYYGDVAKFERARKDMVAQKWLTPAGLTPEGIMTHEFGHAVDFSLQKSKDALIPYVRLDGTGLASNLRTEFLASSRATRKVSTYATTNAREGWAEGFAMREHVPRGEWPTFVKRQDELIKALQGRRYTPEEYDWITDLPRDQQAAARDFVNVWWDALKKKIGVKG